MLSHRDIHQNFQMPIISRFDVSPWQQQQHLRWDRFFKERDLHQLVLDGSAGPRGPGSDQGKAGLRRERGVGAALRPLEEGVGDEVPAQKGSFFLPNTSLTNAFCLHRWHC